MATAILTGVLAACTTAESQGDEPRISRFIATVQSEGSASALRSRFGRKIEVMKGENVKAMKEADIVLLGIKPYLIDKVLRNEGIYEALKGKLVISVLVGSPIWKLEDAICLGQPSIEGMGTGLFIKRAMMNIAAQYGASITVIETTEDIPASYDELTDWIFLQCGEIQPVPPELYDVGGVLAGASGAMLSVAFDGMLDGAVSQGLKRADAKKILTQALFSLATLLENGEHPAVLREKFSSPKGTTIDGLLSLEEDRARYAFSRAVIASSKRSREIGK